MLPSFITAPVRQPAPVAETPPAEPAETREAGAAEATQRPADTAAPRPRRGRPRRASEPAANAEEGAPANDDSSPAAVK